MAFRLDEFEDEDELIMDEFDEHSQIVVEKFVRKEKKLKKAIPSHKKQYSKFDKTNIWD